MDTHERRAKARTVASLRSQVDHLLLMRHYGAVDEAKLDRISDQLSVLSRTAPFLTLAEVEDVKMTRR